MHPLLNQRPDSTEEELDAFDATCERLAGFDAEITYESIDGFLTALAAGPSLAAVEEWLPALCGDAFERAFADPEDHARSLRPLLARLNVLRRQLDPEALLERVDEMRLLPLWMEITDAERQRIVDEGAIPAEEAVFLQTGALWAQGFLDAVQAFPEIWVEPENVMAAADFGVQLDQIAALMLPPGSEEAQAHAALYWSRPERNREASREPSRDDLLSEACWAVQDLRLYWVDHAPKPPTRRVAPLPGRNDPCPCGSGRKYKKCCGPAAAA
jgi:uncharacterized protein